MTCQLCGQVHVVRAGPARKDGTRHGAPCKDHKKAIYVGGVRQPLPYDQWTPCGAAALVGMSVCSRHGGSSIQAKRASERAKIEREATRMAHKWGLEIDTTPTEAILTQVKVWAGLERYYREQAEALTDEERIWGRTKQVEGDVVVGNGPLASLDKATTITEEAKSHILVQLHAEASEKLVKFCAEAISKGIEERRVRLAEQMGGAVVALIDGIVGELGLNPRDPKVAGVVARHLKAIA